MKRFYIFLCMLFLMFSCEPKNFKVTFDSDGGSAVDPVVVKAGETVAKPENPKFP